MMSFGVMSLSLKLLEYKGKELLKGFGIPVQKGVVVSSVLKMCLGYQRLKSPLCSKGPDNGRWTRERREE